MINKSIKYCLILTVLIINILKSQSMYTTYSGFTTPTTPVLPSGELHPSLFFKLSDINEIKNRASLNSYFSSIWASITSNVKTYKSKTASAMDESDRPRMAKYCAFAWIINGDTTAKQKAIDALMIAFDNIPQTTTAADFGGNYDEIYRATWLQNYCEAYDWIYSQLTPAQDQTIRGKLLYHTMILKDNMVDSIKYAPRPHNHRSKPAYAIGTACLTFSNDSRASGWLQFVLTQINTVTAYQFSADGIYREGGHYDLYAAVNAIPFLWHYKNVSGVDLFAINQPMFEWPLAARMGQGWLPMFEDSYLKPFPTHMVARAYTNSSSYLNPTVKFSELLQWHFFNTNIFDPAYTGASNDVCWDIDEYLLYDNTINQTAPSVSPSIDMKWGETILRKSWNYKDHSNRYLVFNGVAEADNHNHPDQLTFNIEAENSVMASNCGYGPAGSSDPNRNNWYLTPEANNGIIVDSTASIDSAVNVTPNSRHFISGTNYNYIEKEISYANGADWKRGISFPHQNYWIVNDIVRSSASTTSILTLHSRGTIALAGNNAGWTTPQDIFGSKALFDSYIYSSANSSLLTQPGFISPFWGYEDTVSYISVSNKDTASMFLSVLYPHPYNTSKPVVANQNGSGYLGAIISYGDTIDTHLFKKNNQLVTVGNIKTDALYSWLATKSSAIIAFAVTEGESVYWHGNQILSSPVIVSLEAYFINNSLSIFSDSLQMSVTLQIKLPFAAASLSSLKFNNMALNYSVVGDSTISFNTNSVLPVELKSFNAVPELDNKIKLSWETASELSNEYFDIERSVNNSDFIHIASIKGKGTTFNISKYEYTDDMVQGNHDYLYRLKQVDANGMFSYSGKIKVDFNSPVKFYINQNYPNPFNPDTEIEYSIPNDSRVEIYLYNTLGEKVDELLNEFKNSGTYKFKIDCKNMAGGIYFCQLITPENSKTIKMIYLK